ncbi:MAG: cytotoxin [Deltaproteobacteria bacterium]|nr:MAG: cytotoxin [Deltaproteobacteria bacterium]
MRPYRVAIAPQVAGVIRALHPDLKRSVKNALRALSAEPSTGEPLRRDLEGLWKYRVRRFRIVYAIDRASRVVQVLAVGHRRTVYEELTEERRRPRE